MTSDVLWSNPPEIHSRSPLSINELYYIPLPQIGKSSAELHLTEKGAALDHLCLHRRPECGRVVCCLWYRNVQSIH